MIRYRSVSIAMGLLFGACGDTSSPAGTDATSSTSTTTDPAPSPTTTPDGSSSTTSASSSSTDDPDPSTTAADTGPAPDVGVVNPCPADVDAGQLIEHVIAPQDTDPAIDAYLDDHYAILDTREVPPRGKLLLFLAGSNGTPAGTVGMLHEAARLGYHTVGLRYPNDFDIYALCGQDPDCFGLLRQEELDGGDHTPVVDVGTVNGIEHRLVALLELLHTQYPDEGWCWWIDGDVPRWSEVIVAGHSHGASTAGLIGTVRSVDRVVMFAGPYDHVGDATPATWVTSPTTTPMDRYFGIAGAGDEQYSQHLVNWEALGLPGDTVDIDANAPPYGGSHRLVSASGDHGSVVSNEANRPAWEYLFE